MKNSGLERWMSVGGNLAVFLGLILVAYQINHETELQKIQLFSDATTAINEFNLSMLGDDPTAVLAKSVENPASLSLAEMQLMDAYLATALHEIRRLEILRSEGLLAEGSMYGIHHYYFGSEFAKAWFDEFGVENIPEVTAQQILTSDPNYIKNYYRNVLDNLERQRPSE